MKTLRGSEIDFEQHLFNNARDFKIDTNTR